MKKLLVGLLAIGSISSFAGYKEATLSCDGIASIDIPSVKVNNTRYAVLTKNLDGKYANMSRKLPRSSGSYGFNLSFNDEVLNSIPLKDYYSYRDRQTNMQLNSDNTVQLGYYSLDAGVLSLINKGAAELLIEIPEEKTVYYRSYNSDSPTQLFDVANASLTFENGEVFKSFCSFKFYGE